MENKRKKLITIVIKAMQWHYRLATSWDFLSNICVFQNIPSIPYHQYNTQWNDGDGSIGRDHQVTCWNAIFKDCQPLLSGRIKRPSPQRQPLHSSADVRAQPYAHDHTSRKVCVDRGYRESWGRAVEISTVPAGTVNTLSVL